MWTSFPVFYSILAVVLAAGLAGWQYYFSKRPANWGWLFSLRMLTYLVLFALLLNPKITQKTYHLEKPKLVVAVDNSRSIDVLNQQQKTTDLIENFKANKALQEQFAIETYSFGSQFKPLDSLNFTESQSDIGAVFNNLNQLFSAQPVPVVLFTDGNQTLGQDYEFAARSYTAPIYAVVLGDTTHYADVYLSKVNANRYAFLHNEFPVEMFVNYQGDTPQKTHLTITHQQQVVFKKELSFSKTHTAEIVTTHLKASTLGLQNYTISLSPLQVEKNTDNNQWKFAVEVIDQQTKVLLLSAFPHPDLGALKKAVEQNAQRRADIKYIGKDSLKLADYQLVVLYQPTAKFKAIYPKLNRLKLHTLTITGTETDYDFLNQQQDLFVKKSSGQAEDYFAVLNAAYRNFQMPELNVADFPPLKDQFGSLEIKDKTVQPLLFQSIRGYKTDQPLLFTFEKNGKRGGYWFGENTWQWRAQSYRDTGSFKTYDEFIAALVQYLASTKQRDRLTVDYKSSYNEGESLLLKALYFDKNYKFDARAKLSATLINTATKETHQLPFLLSGQQYSLNLSHLQPGEYKFTVKVKNENLQESGQFQIIDFDVEQQFTHSNPEKLSRIAALYYPSQIQNLLKNLLQNEAYKPVQKSEVKKSPLIDWWYLLAALALSLGAEWFIRKYRGML